MPDIINSNIFILGEILVTVEFSFDSRFTVNQEHATYPALVLFATVFATIDGWHATQGTPRRSLDSSLYLSTTWRRRRWYRRRIASASGVAALRYRYIWLLPAGRGLRSPSVLASSALLRILIIFSASSLSPTPMDVRARYCTVNSVPIENSECVRCERQEGIGNAPSDY